MKTSIDLHNHSTASDGTLTPTQIVQKAVGIGLKGIALTDHDTVSGLHEFLAEAARTPEIECVPGVEIAAHIDDGLEIHILGLFINPDYTPLQTYLHTILDKRNERNVIIVEKLRALKIDITLEELQQRAQGESIGRPIFAQLLIEKGYASATQDAFDRYLRRGAPAYVAREIPKAQEAIDYIHRAGGVAVWAHPVYHRKNVRAYVAASLEKLIPLGIDGLECNYTTFTDYEHNLLMRMCAQHSLLHSGGSDFHGAAQPDIQMGCGYGRLSVPYAYLAPLRKRAAHYAALAAAKTEE